MPKIAEIVNDVIVNVVMADTVADVEQLHGRECLDLSNFPEEAIPGVGWVRTNGVFAWAIPEIVE